MAPTCPRTAHRASPAQAFAQLACIASYDHSVGDAVLNYVALVVASGAVLSTEAPRGPRVFLILSLLLCQFALCVIVGCAGVSIVWGGLGAIIALDVASAPRRDAANAARAAVVAGLFGVVVYYAVVAPIITTVAHVCAVVLGASLYPLVPRRSAVGRAPPSHPPPQNLETPVVYLVTPQVGAAARCGAAHARSVRSSSPPARGYASWGRRPAEASSR